MKQRLCGILLSGLLSLSSGMSGGSYVTAADEATLQQETGINYNECTETINNPGMGYTSTLWYRCKPGNTPVHNPVGSLVLMFVDIGAFSSGENGTKNENGEYIPGTDYPFDDAFFEGLRGTFANCRANGCTIALRFRYDDDGTQNPEPATFDFLKSHIRQIAESRILEEYQDILMYVESGFVGCYGEQWGGKYCSLEQKAELLDLLLDVVPDPIPVTVRTPNIFAKWAGIEQKALGEWVSEAGSRASRVGIYDDGYMGSDIDLGTYVNREIETKWLGNQTRSSYFGGEFSGNLEFAQKYETYLPQNAIPEMYRTHLSYINSNIWNLYQDYIFSADYDVQKGDHSAYYGINVQKFIRDHLGYRFVLRNSVHSDTVKQGETLNLAFSVENTGFANPIREQKAELLLEKDGNYLRTPLALDSRLWESCEMTDAARNVHLPDNLPVGDWNIYLKLSVGDNTVSQLASRSVRFANDGIWNASLGANYLGTVQITARDPQEPLTGNSFGETENPHFYTINNLHITDGEISNSGEYGSPAAKTNNATLYLANDEQYFYVAAEFPDAGEAPVFNLQLMNQDNNTSYWIYYASNGYVYFNHGTPEGCLQKHSAHSVEFRIPLGDVMGLQLGTALTNVRFFLQDSANDWKLLSDVKAAEYKLTGDFPVYSAPCTVSLMVGGSFPLSVFADVTEPQYQWYHNDEKISGAISSDYTIPAANTETVGQYSVEITSASGTIKRVTIYEVLAVYPALPGDFNSAGKFDHEDAVALAQYLLAQELQTVNPSAGDFNADGKLTGVDLTLMKRALL